MENKLKLLDLAIATVSLPDSQVLSGDLGTIVEVYAAPDLADEVELVNPDGSTRALLTMFPNQVRKLESTDVITTRSLSIAA